MKWHELKEQVDKSIEESGCDKDSIVIEYIDVSYPEKGRVDVSVCDEDLRSPYICVTSHS